MPILRGAVHEHEGRAEAGALVSDLEPVRPNDLHRLKKSRERPQR